MDNPFANVVVIVMIVIVSFMIIQRMKRRIR